MAVFHGVVGLFQTGLAEHNLVVFVVESWWVSHGWVDVLQSDREVNDEEIEVVDLPVLELLLENWLDAVLVVERLYECQRGHHIFPGACPKSYASI